jgi:hypothetical protein
MRLILALLLLPLATAEAQTAGPSLRWRGPDATGLAAWRALLAAEPDLAAETRAARFRTDRGLAQISTDLDGDGREEVLLHMDLPGWCGSAGCAVFVMRRAADGDWRSLCLTNAHRDRPIRLLPPGGSGWRGFDATARVVFEQGAKGAITCREEPLPRRR